MAQENVWEKEYQKPKLVTKHDKPQADALRFFKYVKKTLSLPWHNITVLDLGSGTGRNANYLAEQGSEVVGIEISNTAISTAQKRSGNLIRPPRYLKQSMGELWPLEQGSVNVVLDILSSNSLSEPELAVYLSELKRVLKPGGLIMVKALLMDGDKNTQNLLRLYPGVERNTYTMPELGLTERVFSEKSFREVYRNFDIVKLEKKASKVPFNGQVYNRRFIVAYLTTKNTGIEP